MTGVTIQMLDELMEKCGANKNRFPKLPEGKTRCVFGNSKWRNAEEERIVEFIVHYALERGSWSAVPLAELKRRAESSIVFGDHHPEKFSSALSNIIATGDIRIIKDEGVEIVVPLEELAQTLGSSTLNWI